MDGNGWKWMEIDGNGWKWMEIVDLNGFEGYPTLRTDPQRKEMLDRTTTRRQSMFGLSASGLWFERLSGQEGTGADFGFADWDCWSYHPHSWGCIYAELLGMLPSAGKSYMDRGPLFPGTCGSLRRFWSCCSGRSVIVYICHEQGHAFRSLLTTGTSRHFACTMVHFCPCCTIVVGTKLASWQSFNPDS